MPLVLLVEDRRSPDAVSRDALTPALTGAGHAVRPVGTALAAVREVTTGDAAERPDLVILDLGRPGSDGSDGPDGSDGSDALRMLRAVCDVPVIVATARRSETEMIRMLHAGADDYVTKPLSPAHLAARISAVLRRSRPAGDTAPDGRPLRVGDLEIDPARREARLAGVPLELTRKEYDLLSYLAARAGRVVTRREIVTEIWRQPYVGAEQTLDVHLSWLRRKLGESGSAPRLLRTVRGVGVMLTAPGPPAVPGLSAVSGQPIASGLPIVSRSLVVSEALVVSGLPGAPGLPVVPRLSAASGLSATPG
jgi:DNA-binding response OmpR family regulator